MTAHMTEFARLEAERRIAQAWADASEHIEPSDFGASEIESLSVRADVELPGALWCQCCRDALPVELVRGLRLDGRDDTYTSTATIVTIDGVEHVRLCRVCAAEFVSKLGGGRQGPDPETGAKIVDLFEALKRSLGGAA